MCEQDAAIERFQKIGASTTRTDNVLLEFNEALGLPPPPDPALVLEQLQYSLRYTILIPLLVWVSLDSLLQGVYYFTAFAKKSSRIRRSGHSHCYSCTALVFEFVNCAP